VEQDVTPVEKNRRGLQQQEKVEAAVEHDDAEDETGRRQQRSRFAVGWAVLRAPANATGNRTAQAGTQVAGGAAST
jgi:hypothetical protein